MLLTSDELIAAIDVLESPEEVVYANACALLESIGFEGPMYSAGPFERLLRIYKEEILPRINEKKEQFESWVLITSLEIKAGLDAAIAGSFESAKNVRNDIVSYILGMQREGLAGPKTARIVFLFATADALKKLIETDGLFRFDSLTVSEVLMIALAMIRMKMDASGEMPNEK
jgi:hypothetical protein